MYSNIFILFSPWQHNQQCELPFCDTSSHIFQWGGIQLPCHPRGWREGSPVSPPPSCSLICQDCVHCTKSSFAFCRGQEKCGDCRHACLKLLIYAAWVLVRSEVLWQQHRSSGGSGHLKNSVPLEYRSVNERGIVFFRGPGVRIQLCNSGQRIIHTHKSLSDVFCWCRTRVWSELLRLLELCFTGHWKLWVLASFFIFIFYFFPTLFIEPFEHFRQTVWCTAPATRVQNRHRLSQLNVNSLPVSHPPPTGRPTPRNPNKRGGKKKRKQRKKKTAQAYNNR